MMSDLLTPTQLDSLTHLLATTTSIPNFVEKAEKAGGIGNVVHLKPIELADNREGGKHLLVNGRLCHAWAFGPSGPLQWIIEVEHCGEARSLVSGKGRAAMGPTSIVAILDSSSCGYRDLVLGKFLYRFDGKTYRPSGGMAGRWTRVMITVLRLWHRISGKTLRAEMEARSWMH
jgi:hypothetical protein